MPHLRAMSRTLLGDSADASVNARGCATDWN